MSDDRVLVTGAAGFIGGHLVAHLRRMGIQVAATDIQPQGDFQRDIPWHHCDLLDAAATKALLLEVRPTCVLHLAARTDLNETNTIAGYAANIDGVDNLLDGIRAAGTVRRLICTSSQLVCYVGYEPTNDQDYRPTTLYGESKVLTEKKCRTADGAGASWCLVRPTTVWGPRMNPHYLRFFSMIRDGKYVHVGRGPTRKSYSYVGNIVQQYVALMNAPADRVHRRMFYLADYTPIAIEGWAEAFRSALGAPRIRAIPTWVAKAVARGGDLLNSLGYSSFPFNSFRLRNVLTPYRADTAPIAAVCETLPYSMEDGVAKTADWLREVWADEAAKSGQHN